MNRSKKVLTLSLANLVGSMTTIGIGVTLSRLLSKSDYASYNQIFVLYQTCAAFFLLGLPKSLLYFIPRSENKSEALKQWVSNVLALCFLGCFLGCLMNLVLADLCAKFFNKPVLSSMIKTMSWYPVFLFPTMTLPSCLVALNREKAVAAYTILSKSLIFLLVSIAAYYFELLISVLWVRIIIALVCLISSSYIMLYYFDFKYTKPDYRIIFKQLQYSVPLSIGGAIAVMQLAVDKFVVGHICGDEIFALYTNGAIEIPLLGLLAGQIGVVLMPDLSKASMIGNLNSMHKVWSRSASIVAMFVFPMMMFLLFYAEEIMVFLFSKKYIGSAIYLQIYSLMLPFRIVQFGAIFAAMNKGKLVIVRSCIALLLNAIISYPMVLFFGAEAAAWTTVLITVGFTIPYCIYWVSKWMNVSFLKLLDYKLLMKVVLFSFMSAIVSNLFFRNEFSAFYSLAFSAAVMFSIYLLICLIVPSTKKEVLWLYSKIVVSNKI